MALAGTFAGCGAEPDPRGKGNETGVNRPPRDRPADAIPVEVATATQGPISAFLSFNSTLETEAVVDVFPQIGGQVEKLFAEEGQVVKEGEPLLKIEDREVRIELSDAEINFRHLQQTFGRIESIFGRELINQQEYDDKRFQLEQSRLRLERAQVRLDYTTVKAPFSGVVSMREVQVGSRVGTGTKLFSVVKLDEIVARVFVPGRYLPIVSTSQRAVVTSEFLPGRNFEGWVKRISPVIDPKSGTFKVTIGVLSGLGELPPGLFVAAQIITDTRPEALLIPKRAVVYEGGERYIYTVVENRAAKQRLDAGFEDVESIEARSGLKAGTLVIVVGQNGLKDGALVRIVPPAPSTGTGINAATLRTPPSVTPAPTVAPAAGT